VAEFLAAHPAVDVVFGDVVMIAPDGSYLRHRKMQTPLPLHTRLCHLSTLSCATFFRRRLFFEQGFEFDSRWQTAGDAEWMLRLLGKGVRMAVLGRFTSAFTCTGSNLGAGAAAGEERRRLAGGAPLWARAFKPAIILHHRLRRWRGGMYSQAPFAYEVYTRRSLGRRERFEVEQPEFRPSAEGSVAAQRQPDAAASEGKCTH
jgi:hypothetical protein